VVHPALPRRGRSRDPGHAPPAGARLAHPRADDRGPELRRRSPAVACLEGARSYRLPR
jgi:hypothetical protein